MTIPPQTIDETHDPARESWVESANDPESDFPLQNLPFGVFEDPRAGSREGAGRACVAIGDRVIDLRGLRDEGWLDNLPRTVLDAIGQERLNGLMARTPGERQALRRAVADLLSAGTSAAIDRLRAHVLHAESIRMLVPARIGDYTDFYASIFHATRVGRLFRPDNPLLPNYKFVPIGYHGRASSIVASGTPVVRPRGQTRPDPASAPVFGPSRRLDYELEVGLWVSAGNALGEPVPVERAEEHAFGLCLVNDWSARDVQQWEYQPLGPFLAKNFATTVSPWVVTLEALAPFRAPAFVRPADDPAPLPYLDAEPVRRAGGFDLRLEVHLSSAAMRELGTDPMRVTAGNLSTLYWTFSQLIAHHASNGCNLRPGDLLASGTVSGPDAGTEGCLLELTAGGASPLILPSGEKRRFLENGDEVVMRGWCQRPGFRRIGLGECRGTIVPAG
ncbi:MAG TPA: fumarylacetoacetase [Vicinamibacterales bacterium]|nr:fumarylacetoacetase [Vicinamibacterales bacterium]